MCLDCWLQSLSRIKPQLILAVVGIISFFIIVKIYRNWIARILSRFLFKKGKEKLAQWFQRHISK